VSNGYDGYYGYCSANRCTQCLTNSHCDVHTSIYGCGSPCVSGECRTTTNTSMCGGSTPQCLHIEKKCVECTDDFHCSGDMVCHPTKNKCVDCVVHGNCRDDDNCDATCVNNECKDSPIPFNCLDNNGIDVHCNTTQPHCSNSNTCEKCVSNSHCRTERINVVILRVQNLNVTLEP
jgi:hypothetical protein